MFLQQLGNHAGWQLAWAQVDPIENVRISQLAMADPAAFTSMLRDIISPVDITVESAQLIARRPPPGSEP